MGGTLGGGRGSQACQPATADAARSATISLALAARPLTPSLSLFRGWLYRRRRVDVSANDVGGAPGCIRGVRDIRWRLRAIHPSTPPAERFCNGGYERTVNARANARCNLIRRNVR